VGSRNLVIHRQLAKKSVAAKKGKKRGRNSRGAWGEVASRANLAGAVVIPEGRGKKRGRGLSHDRGEGGGPLTSGDLLSREEKSVYILRWEKKRGASPSSQLKKIGATFASRMTQMGGNNMGASVPTNYRIKRGVATNINREKEEKRNPHRPCFGTQ